jgi:hypothetical protein
MLVGDEEAIVGFALRLFHLFVMIYNSVEAWFIFIG